MKATSPASAAALQGQLRSSRDALMKAIAGLDEETLRAHPAPSEWTPAQILAHLLDYEQLFLARMRAALVDDAYVVTPRPDAERDAHMRLAQRMVVPQIVHGLLALRRDSLQFLDALSPEQLARPFRHPRLGDHTIAWVLARFAEHESEHATQLAEMRTRLTPVQA
jgi:uncharacterized damage-inducible protein DinB